MDGEQTNSIYYLVSPKTSPTLTTKRKKYQPPQTNLHKAKSKSLFKLNEMNDNEPISRRGSMQNLRRSTSQTLKQTANNAKCKLSEAANKFSLQLPTHKDLIQKLFPADFSPKEVTKMEDFNQSKH